MKLTNETLRELYLKDLAMPDTFHGRTTPKVKNINHWKTIEPFASTTFRALDPFGQTNIYVWSDIHFGHANIIKYCNRPFPNWNLMNECLIGNYLNVVKQNDIVIFGGDIGFMKEHIVNDILFKLPGYKIQIVGNHDIHRDGTLHNLAFDERHLCFVVDCGEHQLLFTHYPLTSVPDGCVNYHGHIHDKIVPGNKHINMCVEHTGYKPALLKDYAVARISKQERSSQKFNAAVEEAKRNMAQAAENVWTQTKFDTPGHNWGA